MSYIGRKLNNALIKKQNSKREIDYRNNNDIAHNYVFYLSAGILIRQSQTIICTSTRYKKERQKKIKRERYGSTEILRETEKQRNRETEKHGDRQRDKERLRYSKRQNDKSISHMIEKQREINESDFFKVYLGDSNRQPQPSRENLECYPWTNPSKSKGLVGNGQ